MTASDKDEEKTRSFVHQVDAVFPVNRFFKKMFLTLRYQKYRKKILN